MPVRIGLIGYGLAGATFHAPLIGAVERLQLAAVATSRTGEAARLGSAVRIEPEPERLISDPSLDLIVVATPNETHFPLARDALAAGKHVVVDKPLALNVEEADALIALARQAGRLLSPFHNRRWDGDYLTARELIESGRLGEVMLYEAHWDRFRPDIKQGWRELPAEGAGLLSDLGPHLVDQALQLFGAPSSISAEVIAQRPEAAVDDYFELTLRYGRMRAVLSASTLVAAPRPRFSIHGTGGSFVKYGLDPQEAMLKAGSSPSRPGFGEDDPSFFGILTTADGRRERIATKAGRYADYYEAVADSLLHDGPPPVDPADALEGLRIIAAARQDAKSREGTAPGSEPSPSP